MYFNPKEGLNVDSNSKKLFDLCAKVLKDYALQQSELVSIMNSKRQEEHSGSSRAKASDEKDLDELHIQANSEAENN